MKIITCISICIISFSILFFLINNFPNAYSTNQSKGGFSNELDYIRYSNDNVAYQEVGNGNLDVYLSQIPLQLMEDAKKNPNLNIYEKNGLSYGLLINPAASDAAFNPFSKRDIRFAINFLIDRNFIVNDMLKGFGSIITEPYGSSSPEYQNIMDVVEPLKIHYDPLFAYNIISKSMVNSGAKKDSAGKWIYNGTPVVVKILIRNDDVLRKTFGDLVASELEKIGFIVNKEYGDLIKANRIVYGSNPLDLEWNLYTESFISGAFSRYDSSTVGFMYAPWFGNLPGAQNPAFWQYSNSTIDKITQKLIFNNYTSKEERDSLLKKAESIGLNESVRLFFARSHDPYIASNKINGLINDYSAGIANKLSIMNAQKISGSNSTLKIGMKQIYQDAWNNVDGCKDFYCRQVYSLITDDAIYLHPYSGDPVPFRNNWTKVISSDPFTKVKVPQDAITWNAYNQTWISDNRSSDVALTKIIIHPLFSKWHSGNLVDKFDLLYSFYFPYEWAINTKKNDKTFDAEYSTLILPSLKYIKGIKMFDNGTFESYVDLWHYDKRQLPSYGTLWPSEPWEITAATERLVMDNKLSYSKTASNINHNDQLSLILPSHAQLIKMELEKMKQERYIPNPLKGKVSVEYAIKRYDTAIAWISNHNNAVIGNGPYYLELYNPTGGLIKLKKFEDNSYPYSVGYFSKYLNPQTIKIDKVDVPRFIKIGKPFEFSILLSNQKNINNSGNSTGIIKYFISDRNNKIVTQDLLTHPITLNSSNVLINIDENKTKNISIGPAKLKLFVSFEDSPRPNIFEFNLIARP